MKFKLFPQQVKAANHLKKNNGGCLWMVMRSGKVLSTLVGCAIMQAKLPMVIVAPRNTWQSWEDQIDMCGANLKNTQRCIGTKKIVRKMLENPKKINFIGYTQARLQDVLQYGWGVICLDESIKIGNLNSLTTEYFLSRATQNCTAVKICLSGSPASEGLVQLIPQMCWQRNGDFFGYQFPDGFDEYMMRYWRWSDLENRYVMKRKAHKGELLDWVANRTYGCTMSDIGLSTQLRYRVSRILPPLAVVSKICELRVGKLYMSVTKGRPVPLNPLTKASFEMSLAAGRDCLTGEIFDTTKQQHILNEWDPKDPIPFIVFSRLKEPLRCMPEMFAKLGGKGVYLDSQSPGAEKVIKTFQNGGLDALFLQTDGYKMGTTLDRADKIFYLNNSFSNDTRTQSGMRGTSLNKKTPVEIIDVVFAGCFEELVVEKLIQKKVLSDSAIRSGYSKFAQVQNNMGKATCQK